MQRDSKIEQYLLGQMSPSEEAEFEELFVTDHSMLAQLELAERLHRGMKALEKDDLFLKVNTEQKKVAWFKKRVPAWSLAASIFVGVLTGYMGFNNDTRSDNTAVNVVNLELASQRSNTSITAKVAQRSQQTLLSIYIDRAIAKLNYPAYMFELFDDHDKPVFSSQSIMVNAVDMLYVNLGQTKFESGEYRFQLVGLDDNERQVLMSGDILFE